MVREKSKSRLVIAGQNFGFHANNAKHEACGRFFQTARSDAKQLGIGQPLVLLGTGIQFGGLAYPDIGCRSPCRSPPRHPA
jgi:hypothetical protein